jgi:hypothetical protein
MSTSPLPQYLFWQWPRFHIFRTLRRFGLYWKSFDFRKFTVSAGTPVELAVDFVVFPESLQANIGVARGVGHGHFLLNPSNMLFIYPSTVRRCMV